MNWFLIENPFGGLQKYHHLVVNFPKKWCFWRTSLRNPDSDDQWSSFQRLVLMLFRSSAGDWLLWRGPPWLEVSHEKEGFLPQLRPPTLPVPLLIGTFVFFPRVGKKRLILEQRVMRFFEIRDSMDSMILSSKCVFELRCMPHLLEDPNNKQIGAPVGFWRDSPRHSRPWYLHCSTMEVDLEPLGRWSVPGWPVAGSQGQLSLASLKPLVEASGL